MSIKSEQLTEPFGGFDFSNPFPGAAAPHYKQQQRPSGISRGHSRTDSTSSRRHSIQLDGSDHKVEFDLNFLSQGIDKTTSNDDFDFMATFTHQDQSEFLLSPPRMTVSLSQGAATLETPGNQQAKRHRLAPSDVIGGEDGQARMSRSVGNSPNPDMASLVLETPPPRPTGQVQSFLPPFHRDSLASMMHTPHSSASTQTPFSAKSTASSSSYMTTPSLLDSASSTASERSVRRMSIGIQDGSPGVHRAIPGGLLGARKRLGQYPEAPKSAPPVAPLNAMQVAQDAARLQNGHHVKVETPDKGDKAGLGKGGEVWPDDVEVAFWEGE